MAEGKERLGLKDLARLVAEQGNTEVIYKPTTDGASSDAKGKQSNSVIPVASNSSEPNPSMKMSSKKKGKRKKHKKHIERAEITTPVATPVASPVTPTTRAAITPKASTPSINGVAVKPAIEYQEKSTVEIRPSHSNLPLSTPVKHPENYANKDNSVDGFLAIKHS